MNISNLSLKKKKEIFGQLLIIFGIKSYELKDLSIKNGKVVKFSRSYGPWKDEWNEVSANKYEDVVKKFKLMIDLDKEIKRSENDYHNHINNMINTLATNYSDEDLSME
jgi:hypothetical protein